MRVGLSEGETLEQGPKWHEGASIPARGFSKCKSPETGVGDEIRKGPDMWRLNYRAAHAFDLDSENDRKPVQHLYFNFFLTLFGS